MAPSFRQGRPAERIGKSMAYDRPDRRYSKITLLTREEERAENRRARRARRRGRLSAPGRPQGSRPLAQPPGGGEALQGSDRPPLGPRTPCRHTIGSTALTRISAGARIGLTGHLPTAGSGDAVLTDV